MGWKHSYGLWILAFVIMVVAAYYQRLTGPTHPVKGNAIVGNVTVKYSLTRSSEGEYEQSVPLVVSDKAVTGRIFFKRHKTQDTLTSMALQRKGDSLIAILPHQPAAGKLEYHITLDAGGAQLRLPETGAIVTRSRDSVPAWLLFPHILVMFIGMMFAVRAGLEVMRKDPRPYMQTLWALALLIVGGLVFGPFVQKFSFGTYWSGWPFGGDLTDNKTIVMVIVWAAAFWMNRKNRSAAPTKAARWMVLAATILTLVVYLIPHSMLGSEIDYSKAQGM
jgi:hypothetical protein